jgi:hypothetical protein
MVGEKLRDVSHLTLDTAERRQSVDDHDRRGEVLVISSIRARGLGYLYMKRDDAKKRAKFIGSMRLDGVPVKVWALEELSAQASETLARYCGGGPFGVAHSPSNEKWEEHFL